ncbi:4420_t:CDS:2, partial [Acaulospora colombiana]
TNGGITANGENVSPRDGNQSRSTIALNEVTSSRKLMPQVSPIEKHSVAESSRPPIELHFPPRFTISEEQLATTQLDTISSDLEEDFELDWETGSDSDMDFHTNSSTPDSWSEVSSSPPARSMLRSMTSIPIAVPRTPTRSRTLPVSGTPMATSACQTHVPSLYYERLQATLALQIHKDIYIFPSLENFCDHFVVFQWWYPSFLHLAFRFNSLAFQFYYVDIP